MKLSLIFLAICVALSQQQFYRRCMIIGYPWMSPFVHYSMLNDDDNSPFVGDYSNAQARVKGYGPMRQDTSTAEEEMGQNRFLLSSGSSSSMRNPLLKTITFTITSTCTALSITTCVAMTNLSPNPVACAGRRRRFAEYNDEQGEDITAQYPIIPSEVRIVMPTAEPSTGLTRNSRELPFGVFSSMDDGEDSNGMASTGMQNRGKRFFQQIWNGFATGVTVTTWSITSSTLTSTLVIPGVSTVLPCLPAGYGIC
ncbi:uncharacterized protein LOC130689399 isoform X2 [Daphnia carinata]|uniref:uncharacterized protein LOC130689399 isoform X2 n=1 Tax=Daphnia carinata TaxID=120202 RepID=UPI0028692214|nr:uncharacterized protein LOC130689399 isoform X2 [Daphnia carinata]